MSEDKEESAADTRPIKEDMSAYDPTQPVTENNSESDDVDGDKTEVREGILYLQGAYTPYTDKVFWRFIKTSRKIRTAGMKDGKLHGKMIVWNENGRESLEQHYRHGGLVKGSRKHFNRKGEPISGYLLLFVFFFIFITVGYGIYLLASALG